MGAYDDQKAWETCMTIGDQWSYKPNDHYKSAIECVQTLAKCVGGDGNLLLNIGPQPDGQVDPTQADRLKAIAAWMKTHSPSITGTRGGPYKPASSYVSTRKGSTIYVHVLNWNGDSVTLPALPKRIVKSRLVGKGSASVTQTGDGVTISVPARNQDAADTVVALELDGSAMDISPIAPEAPQITASASNVFQNSGDYGADKAFDDSDSSRWASDTGTNPVWLQADFADPKKIQGITIKEAYAGRVQKFEVQYQAPGSSEWITLTTGSKLGEDYATQFAPVIVKAVRLNILEAADSPTISEISFTTAK